MKNAKYISLFAVCLAALLGLLLSFGNGSSLKASVSTAVPTPTPAKRFYAEAKPMSPELAYRVLFEEIDALNQKDRETQLQGQTTAFKTSFYSGKLGLQTAQFSAVDNSATTYLTQIQPLDQRAKDIINQYRSQYPSGKLRVKQPTPPGDFKHPLLESPIEPLPTPPVELGQLQAQKNQLVLDAKERIRQSLGNTAFTAFDASVQKNATRVLVPINFGSHQPFPTPTPGN